MHDMLPASRLLIIERSGHMTTMEQPDAVSQALVDWLEW
jgi:pimeloyl-ACP methyl ester carboxylesterase